MNDDYRQGRLDAIAAVHRLLADIGIGVMAEKPANEAARVDRNTRMEMLLAVSRGVSAMTEAASA